MSSCIRVDVRRVFSPMIPSRVLTRLQLIPIPLILGGLICVFLLLNGLRFGALPFIPGARFSDATTSHFPNVLHLQEAVARGEFPVWRLGLMGGQPFAANPLNKTNYPFQWFAPLSLPEEHLNGLIVIHFIIAGWGMFRWARAMGMDASSIPGGASRIPSLLCAVAYAFTPRMMAHLGAGHLDIIYAAAWFPWVMSAARTFASLPNFRSALTLALFAALALLADVRLSLFILVCAGGYAIILHRRSEMQNAKRFFAYGLVAAALFFVLTAAMILPLYGWSGWLSRAGLTAEEAGVFALDWGHLIGIVIPPPAANPETLPYVGLSVLIFAIIGSVGVRQARGWAVLGAGAALYAMGANGGLWTLFVTLFPPLLWFRVPSRAWFIVALCASLLAGWGMHTLLLRIGNPRRAPLQNARLWLTAGILVMVIVGVGLAITVPILRVSGALMASVSAGLGILFLVPQMRTGRILAWGALIVVGIELAVYGSTWMEWRSLDEHFAPYLPLVSVLQADGASRVYSPAYSLPQEVALSNGLELFGGVDPFQIAGASQAIQRAGGITYEGYSVVQPPLESADPELRDANRSAMPDPAQLAAWGVSHVVAPYAIEHPGLIRVQSEIADIYIYRNIEPMGTARQTETGWVNDMPSISLPSATTVNNLNRLTIISAIVSGITFIIGVVLLLIMGIKRRGLQPAPPSET